MENLNIFENVVWGSNDLYVITEILKNNTELGVFLNKNSYNLKKNEIDNLEILCEFLTKKNNNYV